MIFRFRTEKTQGFTAIAHRIATGQLLWWTTSFSTLAANVSPSDDGCFLLPSPFEHYAAGQVLARIFYRRKYLYVACVCRSVFVCAAAQGSGKTFSFLSEVLESDFRFFRFPSRYTRPRIFADGKFRLQVLYLRFMAWFDVPEAE